MRKQNRLKSLLGMTICIMGASLVTCCTSDDFFQIEEVYEGTDYSILKKIALSKEYIEFQKQSFLVWDIMHDIDTTKKVLLNSYEGRTIYAYEEIVSIKPFFDAKQKLIDSYPDYEKFNVNDKNRILNLAILNNRSLRILAENNKSSVHLTKTSNPESMAYRYAQASEGIQINSHTWRLGSMAYWYTDDFYANIINQAQSKAEDGKEHGGYFFYDCSGILNEDLNAAPDSMTFYWNEDLPNNEQPIQDFHIHPNDVLVPSDYDIRMWCTFPWYEHVIIGRSGGVFQIRIE